MRSIEILLGFVQGLLRRRGLLVTLFMAVVTGDQTMLISGGWAWGCHVSTCCRKA